MPSTRMIIITDILQHTEDNLFEVPSKSKGDNLQETVDELKSMLRSESPLQAQANNPRAKTIDKLREVLL